MASLNGTFKLATSDKFEEYMKEIGVPEQLIKLGNDPNAETTISSNGDDYVITLTAAGRTVEIKFTIGQEFDETTPHGVPVKTVVTRDGNKLVQVQKGNLESTITREVVGDELIVTLQAGPVTSRRTYSKTA